MISKIILQELNRVQLRNLSRVDVLSEDFITFSRKSRRGAIVFLFFFVLIAVMPRIYGLLFVSDGQLERKPLSKIEKKLSTQEKTELEIIDPNKASLKDWMLFGFSEKQAQSIINFKDKIGGFNAPEDLKKSFVIDDKKYNELLPFLKFDSDDKTKNKSLAANEDYLIESADIRENIKEEEIEVEDEVESDDDKLLPFFEKIDLNAASFEELISINGIGEYFAEKIIDERIKRGGFTNLNQLLDIYYFDEDNLKQIEGYVTVDLSQIQQIDLNTVSLKRLSRHPDITWEMARSIIDLREEMKRFESLDQLLLSAHIDLRRFNKIKPYFKIDK